MAKEFLKNLALAKIILAGLVIRLLLLPWAYHDDVVVTYWWGKFASEFGLRGYYDWLNFGGYIRPDQPMLNIYYDWGVRQIYLFFYNIFWFLNINISLFPSKFMQWYFTNGNQVLLKLPMVFSDGLLVLLGYKYVSKYFDEQKGKVVAIILSLFPPLIYNSAVCGSGDSIINLFCLLCIYFFWQKKHIYSTLFFLLSTLYKPPLLIWFPVIIVSIVKNKVKPREIIKTFIFSALFISIIATPFTPLELNPLVWFFQTITTKILPGTMHQLTSNAFNLWALIFGLNPQLDELIILGLISARSLSVIICLWLYYLISRSLFMNFSQKNTLLSLATISLSTFTFMTRMHERYTFPALIPLLVLCFYDKKFIKYFIVLTITHLLNIYNRWWYPTITPLINFLKFDLTIRLLSLTNVVLCLSLILEQLRCPKTK